MNIKITEINNNNDEITTVQEFLYNQIKKEYGIGPTPKFHYDIDGLKEYYLLPERNNFFIAWYGDKIVATAAIRAYDLEYDFFKGQYSKDTTASISEIEDFACRKSYDKIYLHTHRYLEAGLPFWKSLGYVVTVEEDDYDETIHMIKSLI